MSDEMIFDPTAVDNIPQESVEQAETSYPTIQWHYGNPMLAELGSANMKHAGGFFLPADVIDEEALTAAGWTKTAFVHPDQSQTSGFYRRELAVAVIATRKRWEVYQDGSRTPQLFAWSDYASAQAAGRSTSRLQALCLVKGLTKFGPFVLTFKGMASMAFEGTRNSGGALVDFAQTVITRANRESDEAARKANKPAGRRWPYRCFWLPIGAARDAKGTPVFTEAGKGSNSTRLVLPQALGLPLRPEDVALGRFYVGAELLELGNQLYTEAEANWTHAWDKLDSGSSSGSTVNTGTPAANTNGANGNGSAGAAAPVVLAPPASSVLESLGL